MVSTQLSHPVFSPALACDPDVDNSDRCPLCAGSTFRGLSGGFRVCRLCALATRDGAGCEVSLDAFATAEPGVYEFPNWNNWLFRCSKRLGADEPDLLFTADTIRALADREGLFVAMLSSSSPFGGKAVLPWRHGATLRARIEPWGSSRILHDPRITLGIITSVAGQDDTEALCLAMADSVSAIAVALDTDDAVLAKAFAQRLVASLATAATAVSVQVVGRKLQSDFASQRNLVQDMAPTSWVLHLDSDERLAPQTRARLSGIISDAERRGRDGIAFPRRNLVDGDLSALYPDPQNRLVRKTVRFTRAVHEYPQLRHPALHLGGGITHQIARERLERRAATYERIMPGAARPHDTAMLLKRLSPSTKLP